MMPDSLLKAGWRPVRNAHQLWRHPDVLLPDHRELSFSEFQAHAVQAAIEAATKKGKVQGIDSVAADHVELQDLREEVREQLTAQMQALQEALGRAQRSVSQALEEAMKRTGGQS